MAWANHITVIPKSREHSPQAAHKFRPIAINSILGKIFEKLLYHRLYYYFETNNLFPDNQFGFTNGKSAITALYKLKRDIVHSLENKDNIIVISLDITNALGNIIVDRVKKRFRDLEIHKDLSQLVLHMLQDRSISYELGQNKIQLKLNKGAPQGSPLSPFLWNVIVSELLVAEMPETTTIQAFADDLTLVVRGKSRAKLEAEAAKALTIIHEWSTRNELNFSLEKCEFINLGAAYKNRSPVIKTNGISIKRVQQTKILGVIFDSKLSFIPHLKMVKQRIQRITSGLAQFTGTNWGMTPKHLRQIYLGGIKRMIVYGSPIWYPAISARNKNNTEKINRLKAIQRIPLSKIAKSFHTVSNAALNIVCNIPPVHITIERENTIFNIIHGDGKFVFDGQAFGKEDIATKIWPFQTHPAKKRKYDYSKSIEATDYSFYTDGSAMGNKIGAAFVIIDKLGRAIKYKQMKLPEHSNNFEAETVAIYEAIKEMGTMSQTNTYQIVTDSLSTLEALKNANNTNPFVHKIRQQLNQLENTKVRLVYTPAHMGTTGNELADQLAKEATKEGEEYSVPMSISFIRNELRKQGMHEWNKYWNLQGKDSYTYQWIKNTQLIPTSFPPNYSLVQAVTGHGRFPFYFKRFAITDHEQCVCGVEAPSFDHYLDSCKLTAKEIQKLKQKYTKPSNSKLEIIGDEESIEVIEEIVQNINEKILQA